MKTELINNFFLFFQNVKKYQATCFITLPLPLPNASGTCLKMLVMRLAIAQ